MTMLDDNRTLSRRHFLGAGLALAGALILPRSLAWPGLSEGTVIRRRELWSMGGWNFLEVEASSRAIAGEALGAMVESIREMDRSFSVFDPRTPLSRINQAGLTDCPADDPLLLEGIGSALHWARRSGGMFDPTVEPLMRRWGFRDDCGAVCDAQSPDWDYQLIECDARKGLIRRESTRIQVDPGGWAKGWAAQRAVEAAERVGALRAQASCGGDIAWHSCDPIPEYECGIRNPLRGRTDAAYTVRHRFRTVATSGNTETFRVDPDRGKIGHLMNPRTGAPAESDLLSATVFSNDGLAGDAVASALFVMGKERAMTWLGQNQEFAGILIDRGWPECKTGATVIGDLAVMRT